MMVEMYYSKELNEKFLEELKEFIKKEFKDVKTIAIKIHFGEINNKTAFKPEHIKPITNILKELKFNFFMFDSSVAYPGPRANPITHKALALMKGWGKLSELRLKDDFVVVKGKNLDYEVCSELGNADAVLIISHFKGHDCAGFGGAIKNLGMGALTKKTKNAIHDGAKPVFSEGCKLCGNCVRACPVNAMKIVNGKERPVISGCYGCSDCAYACPFHIIKPKLNYFDVLLAEGAYSAQKTFKKHIYISYIINVTKSCDCMPLTSKIISKDAGYLFSKDGVAIDKAAYDLVVKQEKEDVFLKYNKKSGLQQVVAAEKFGMGSSKYKLIEIK